MGMYAVELFFDEATEERLYGIWRGLAEAGINSSMINIAECHPHITLGVYRDEVDLEEMKTLFADFASRQAAFDVAMEAIGTFPTSGTVFISPSMSQPLLKLHTEFHAAFSSVAEHANPYYVPGKWVPHCTFGIRLSAEEAVQAIQYAYQHFGNGFHGQIAEIGLVEINHATDDTCASTPKIVSVKLPVTN